MSELSGPRLRDWAGGLLWGGVLLLFALMFAGLIAADVRDARASAPSLTPSSLAALRLDRQRETLVDVEGFSVDCEHATFDGERLLAPGMPNDPQAAVLIFVRFEHGSDCRDAEASMRGRFRAKAKAAPAELYEQLGLPDQAPGLTLALVEPHAIEYWMLAGLAFMGLLGVFGVHTALTTRKQLLARWRRDRLGELEPEQPVEVARDDRREHDPYRPDGKQRLIGEVLRPAPEFLAKLRRARTTQAALALLVLAGALALVGWMGGALLEQERVWSSGEQAPDATASGEVRRTALIFVHTRLDVTFVDRSGRVHRESASGLSFISSPDDSRPPIVRYLPDEPDRFAVSWLHEQLWGEIVLLVLFGGGLLAAAIALWVSARRDRRPEQVAAVFVDQREALLRLLGRERMVVNGQETGAVTYHFHILDSERSWSHFVAAKRPAPLFLDAAESFALALYNPADPSYLLLLSEDLSELHEPPFTPAQLRGRFLAGAQRESERSEGASS